MVFSPLCYVTFQCNRYNKYFFAHENIKKCSQKQQYFTVQSKIFSTANWPKTSKNIKFGFHKNGSPGDLCIMNFHTGTTRLGSACQLGHREDSGKKTKKLQMSKGIKVLSILEFQMEHYSHRRKFPYIACNKGQSQFQQKSYNIDVQNLKNGQIVAYLEKIQTIQKFIW